MKKLITSKPFIAGTCAVACVAILAVCVMWGNDKHEFIVEDPVPLAGIDSWTENPAQQDGSTEHVGYNPVWQLPNGQPWQPSDGQPANPSADYPKVAEENKDEVVIDFTDPIPSKEPAPEAPNNDAVSGKDDHTAPKTPGSSEKPKDNQNPSNPVPGSMNDKGEIYDPVFGWVKPGNVVQTEIDSDGDPNKMVGSMN